MAISSAPIQQAQANSGGSSVASQVVTLGANPSAGGFVAVGVMLNSATATVSSVTATGLTFTLAKRQAGSAGTVEIWYAMNAPGGSGAAITVTPSTSVPIVVNASEWSGVATTGALDGTQVNGASNMSSTASPGNVTPSNAGDLLITAIYGTNTTGPAAPWTPLTGGTSSGNLGVGYYLPGSTGAVTSSEGQGGPAPWAAAIAAFLPASAPLPTIGSLSPGSGQVGQPVYITGTNFNATPSANTVQFNGVTAVVLSGTTTQLVAVVPVGASTGSVTVANTGGTATSPSPFTLIGGIYVAATGNQALPDAGTIFAEAVVLLSLPGGAPGGVPIGIIQDVSIDEKWTKKKLMGPGSRMPIAVAFSERVVTIKGKNSAFSAAAHTAAVGAALAYASGNTTASSSGNDQPPILSLVLKTPSDGSDMILTFGKVLSDSVSWAFKTHDWAERDFSAEAYPDPTTGLVYTAVFPGNQTTS